MLINDKRALAYTETIAEISEIKGADNIELAKVLGWTLIVKKGEFKVGDRCIYFEVDSRLPKQEWSKFMESKKYKVKPYKLNKFGVVSLGLALPIDDRFGVEIPKGEKVDVTDLLGVTYADPQDTARKKTPTKYDIMYQRKRELIKNSKILSSLWRYKWGRKVLFLFLGKKKDSKGEFPSWVKKTDSERIQNMPYLFPSDGEKYFMTEKIHGTSTTFTARRVKGLLKDKVDFRVCSRNVAFIKDRKEECFYKENVYIQMAEKYNVENWMKNLLEEDKEIEYITLQGETFGDGVQKRKYGLKDEIDIRIFNVVIKNSWADIPIYFNPMEIEDFLKNQGDKLNGLKAVPFLGYATLPNSVEETLALAKGESVLDEGEREGIVFRDISGEMNFKAVDIDFMMKY